MKVFKSLFTLILVITIGILVYFYVYKTEQSRIAREANERMLVQFDLDSIKSFTFSRPDSSIVFVRGTGRIWNIVEPIKVEAEREELYTLFVKLNESEILYNVGEEIENLDIYGLENPAYYMSLDYFKSDPDTLFIGNNTPDGGMTYVRFSSQDRVLTAKRDLTDRLKWPVNVYRSRTLLNVVKEDVTAFEILRKENEIINMTFDGLNWIMRTPWNYPGDTQNMDNIVEKLSKSNKQTLVEEKTDDLAQYGLDDPRIIFTVSLRYGNPEKILLIGDKLTDLGAKHLSYAKQFDSDLIFTINDIFVKDLERILEWYVDKSPVKLNRELVTRIIIEMSDRKIVFSKDYQRNWSVISPVEKNIEEGTINKIFLISSFLLVNKVFAYEPTEKELSEAGINNPNAIITLFQNEQILDRIELGNTVTLEEPLTYFRTTRSQIIFGTKVLVNNEINAILATVFGS